MSAAVVAVGASSDWKGKHETVQAKLGHSASSLHSFSSEEKLYLVKYVNSAMKEDAHYANILPIDPATSQVFDIVSDGIFLCKLLNSTVRDALDERALNLPSSAHGALNTWEIQENHQLFLNSARACGCQLTNIGPGDLQNGTEHLVLAAIWQVVKLGLLSTISLAEVNEIAVLAGADEELQDLHMMPPDLILLRWVNFHLAKSSSWKQSRLEQLGELHDTSAYVALINQIQPATIGSDINTVRSAEGALKYAEIIAKAAEKLGVDKSAIPSPKDLVRANENLILAFLASVFHADNGLRRYFDSRARDSVINFALEDSEDVTRDERTFRMWINSLGCNTYCRHLFDTLHDGQLLLEIIDSLQPGAVDWKLVGKPPLKSTFQKIENCNYALRLSQERCNVTVVSLCGLDIQERKKKATLAIVWQLMRFHCLSVLRSVGSNGQMVSEENLIAWANTQVENSSRSSRLANLSDKAVADSSFLLDLLRSVAPKLIDDSVVVKSDTPEGMKLNAKYVISAARKLGCAIFLSWDDITDARPKMVLSLLAAIMAAVQQRDAIL